MYSLDNNMDPDPFTISGHVSHACHTCSKIIKCSTHYSDLVFIGIESAHVLPVRSVYKLEQFVYSRHVIILPQDVATFATITQ